MLPRDFPGRVFGPVISVRIIAVATSEAPSLIEYPIAGLNYWFPPGEFGCTAGAEAPLLGRYLSQRWKRCATRKRIHLYCFCLYFFLSVFLLQFSISIAIPLDHCCF